MAARRVGEACGVNDGEVAGAIELGEFPRLRVEAEVGIGRGIAKALKAEGAIVLGSDIAAPPAEDGIDFLGADLSKRDGWKSLLDGAVKKLGTISLFVHAASPRRLEADTPLSVSEETWDLMTDINLRSGFFLGREVGRHMRDNRIKGRMILVTSQHRDTPRNLPHYSASKAGMTMVMKELARVLAPEPDILLLD
eukprot:gene46280-61895_t